MAEITWIDPDLGKSPSQLLAERAKRFDDAIHCRKPDRIPILLDFSYMLAELGGVTKQDVTDNHDLAQRILEDASMRFQPDASMGIFGSPEAGLAVGDKMIKWPGHGVGPNDAFQFVEDEYMKPEDYDDFLFSPADWGIRTLLPRSATKLEGLSHLPHLGMAVNGTGYMNLGALTDPAVLSALDALTEAAKLSVEAGMRMFASAQRMAELGFPQPALFTGGMAPAPFDAMSDTLRGMRGIFLDMRRCPDKLLAAIEKMRILITSDTIAAANAIHFPTVSSMLHRGSDGFMSLKQFETFYWPSLKQMWLDCIANGQMTFAFYEGTWNQRLGYLADLPAQKTIGWFQSSDIFQVNEVLGGKMCIMGGMPNSLLQGGTVDEVRAYTKQLCETFNNDGGFIMCTTIGEMEGSKPELVQAWVEATKQFSMI